MFEYSNLCPSPNFYSTHMYNIIHRLSIVRMKIIIDRPVPQVLSISPVSFHHETHSNSHPRDLETYQSPQSDEEQKKTNYYNPNTKTKHKNTKNVSFCTQSRVQLADLACFVLVDQDVPGSKVSVHKALLGQVHHTGSNLSTALDQSSRQVFR